KKLRDEPLTATFLQRAKNKFKGQIALAEESRMSLIISEAKNVLDYGYVIGLKDVFDKIDKVSTEDILVIANDVFKEKNLSSLSFVPED
ncbi:MAG: insulinase family protein, partial [Sphingobacterium sp.]